MTDKINIDDLGEEFEKHFKNAGDKKDENKKATEAFKKYTSELVDLMNNYMDKSDLHLRLLIPCLNHIEKSITVQILQGYAGEGSLEEAEKFINDRLACNAELMGSLISALGVTELLKKARKNVKKTP